MLRRNHPLLRGKLVRQRIGISRNPRRMQRVHTAHLVLMRVSHHRQRDRQVDLLLDPVEDLGGLVIGPGGIDHQHAAAIPDDQTVGSDCPETRHVEIGSVLPDIRCELAENQIAKPLVASFHLLANRRADFTGHAPAQHQCSG